MMRFRRHPNRVLCPVCSSFRETPEFRYPRARAIAIAAGLGVLVGLILFLSAFTEAAVWIGVSAGMLCFLSLEVYYSLQFRRELECPVCHFDPLLYRRSPERAKEQCLDGLKRKEQVLAAKWQASRKERERTKEFHG